MGGGNSSRHGNRRSSALALTLSLALLATAGWAPAVANAQTARPTLSVTPTISAKPASRVALTVRVGALSAVPKGSFVRVRGLPPTVALSEGYSIAPGSWAVPLAALPSLEMTLPQAESGRSEVSITLVSFDGSLIAEAQTVLIIADAPAAPPQERAQGNRTAPPASILRAGTPPPPAPEPVAPSAPAAPPAGQSNATPEQRERALRFLKRGDELMAQGGIAQARLLYERAAEAGLAQGAMALASTYDAEELERLGVRGLQPDRAAALRWYERARQLGAPDASQRLRRLGSN